MIRLRANGGGPRTSTQAPLFAVVILCSAIFLNGCDLGASQGATPTNIAATAADTATTAGSTASGVAVSATAEGPLNLSPVTVETTDATRKGNLAVERKINLPPGFGIRVFATGLSHVRKLALSPDGTLYATVRAEGRVVRLPDVNGDGVADSVQTVADNLQGVHGIAFRGKDLYVATETSIIRLYDDNGDGTADRREVLVSDLPTGGTGPAGANHTTRTIEFGPDGKLYVSIGSSCNACVEQDPRRAAILRYSADGKFEKLFATGLRNAAGIKFHPVTGELWAVNNGRDGLGEDLPPEAIYNLKEGGNYGWPYCYGNRVPDTSGAVKVPPGYCEKTEVPTFTIQAHSAPLGLAFYTGAQFPPEYQGDMFMTSHGSWYRQVRTGYKILRVRFKNNQPDTGVGNLMVEDFATGWLLNPVSGEHWGRPVDPLVAPDGSLFLTDDASMAIYKIYYKGK